MEKGLSKPFNGGWVEKTLLDKRGRETPFSVLKGVLDFRASFKSTIRGRWR